GLDLRHLRRAHALCGLPMVARENSGLSDPLAGEPCGCLERGGRTAGGLSSRPKITSRTQVFGRISPGQPPSTVPAGNSREDEATSFHTCKRIKFVINLRDCSLILQP